MTVRLTRVYRFSSAHRLHSPALSEAANAAVYGKCNNPYGHGHNYVLEVSVRGPVDQITGRVVDLSLLDQLVSAKIVSEFDHRDLNREVPEFAALVPTTENLAVVVEQRLHQAWRDAFPTAEARLEKIRIYETDRNIFDLKAQ